MLCNKSNPLLNLCVLVCSYFTRNTQLLVQKCLLTIIKLYIKTNKWNITNTESSVKQTAKRKTEVTLPSCGATSHYGSKTQVMQSADADLEF